MRKNERWRDTLISYFLLYVSESAICNAYFGTNALSSQYRGDRWVEAFGSTLYDFLFPSPEPSDTIGSALALLHSTLRPRTILCPVRRAFPLPLSVCQRLFTCWADPWLPFLGEELRARVGKREAVPPPSLRRGAVCPPDVAGPRFL